jgi:hypothetical protein
VASDVYPLGREEPVLMTLRGAPLERAVTLPDGRALVVRVGVPDDSYIAHSYLDTVTVEVLEAGRGVAAVNTVLDPEQTSQALELLREIASGLEAGTLPPTAGAIEPLADRLRRV